MTLHVENGRIVTVVTGWDISGEPVELNLGPNFDKNATGFRPGDLVKYESGVDGLFLTDAVRGVHGNGVDIDHLAGGVTSRTSSACGRPCSST